MDPRRNNGSLIARSIETLPALMKPSMSPLSGKLLLIVMLAWLAAGRAEALSLSLLGPAGAPKSLSLSTTSSRRAEAPRGYLELALFSVSINAILTGGGGYLLWQWQRHE